MADEQKPKNAGPATESKQPSTPRRAPRKRKPKPPMWMHIVGWIGGGAAAILLALVLLGGDFFSGGSKDKSQKSTGELPDSEIKNALPDSKLNQK